MKNALSILGEYQQTINIVVNFYRSGFISGKVLLKLNSATKFQVNSYVNKTSISLKSLLLPVCK